MGDGTNFAGDLFDKLSVFGHGSGSWRVEFRGLSLYDSDIHADGGKYLAHAVMKFTSQSLPFLVLHFQKASGKVAQILVSRGEFDRSFLNSSFKMLPGLRSAVDVFPAARSPSAAAP